MSWGRGPKKAKKNCTTTFTSLPPCPCHERLVAVLYQSMTTSLCYYAKSFLVKSPSLSWNAIVRTRCQGHPQARRGTDVRVQGYFHVQHKTSREPAIFTDAMGHRRLFPGKCPGKMEITGSLLDIDVLEFIRYHPLELLLIKRHDNDIDLISLSNLFQAS